MIRLAIIVPVWKRPELARAVIAELHAIQFSDSLAITPIIVRSTGDDFGESDPVHTVHAPNAPLTAKYVVGLQRARTLSCDAFMLWGSDDFAPWESLHRLAESAMLNGHSGSSHLLIHDLPTGRTVRWGGYGEGYQPGRVREPCGPGRTLRRDVLDAVNWNPWRRFEGGLDRGLDGAAHNEIVRAGFQCALVNAPICDVKCGETNITPFEATAGLPPVSTHSLSLHMLDARFVERVIAPLRASFLTPVSP